MREKYRRKTIAVLFTIMIAVLFVGLAASGNNSLNKQNLILHQYDKYYSSKIILIGTIKETQLRDITSFTTIHVLCVAISDYNGTKSHVLTLSEDSKMNFHMKLYRFRGILLKHFISGVFKFPKVTASPGSISCGEPALLEIMVTSNGKGLSGILVNITIPGVTGELYTHTGADGKASFSFVPISTGEIKIEIENKRIPLVVEVTSQNNNTMLK